MLLGLLMLDTQEETEQQTLEQLQTYDEALRDELYHRLHSIGENAHYSDV